MSEEEIPKWWQSRQAIVAISTAVTGWLAAVGAIGMLLWVMSQPPPAAPAFEIQQEIATFKLPPALVKYFEAHKSDSAVEEFFGSDLGSLKPYESVTYMKLVIHNNGTLPAEDITIHTKGDGLSKITYNKEILDSSYSEEIKLRPLNNQSKCTVEMWEQPARPADTPQDVNVSYKGGSQNVSFTKEVGDSRYGLLLKLLGGLSFIISLVSVGAATFALVSSYGRQREIGELIRQERDLIKRHEAKKLG